MKQGVYKSKLSLRDTQSAIELFRSSFEKEFSKILNLQRISAPLLVRSGQGLNDDLSGVERPVRFDVKNIPDFEVEVVQSLAKWKRLALKKYGFSVGEGLFTDMNAIRRDDDLDKTHSIYVDQWDWERVISSEQRNIEFLKKIVQDIVLAIVSATENIKRHFSKITTRLEKDVFFITSQDLFNLYPSLPLKLREHKIAKEKRTVFIMQIGGKLENGEISDNRAPDYDDWQLNGDLLFYNDILEQSVEISSMGIRVDAVALQNQLKATNQERKVAFDYHKGILENSLPLTIGGGIGQSRLCMLVLQKLHIGEAQASIWSDEVISECKKMGVELL